MFVNDISEKGVKLISDLNIFITRNEDQKQYFLQVVHDCEIKFFNSNKKILSVDTQ